MGRKDKRHKPSIAALFSETAHRALKKISDDKLEKSSARDLGILAGVCVDKNRLITGQSTSNQAILLKAILKLMKGNS